MISLRSWIRYNIAFLLVIPPFLIGGVHILTHVVMGSWACIVAMSWSVYARQHPEHSKIVEINAWFWLWFVAIVFTGFQLIPMPLSWIASLSPATAQVLRQTLGGVGLDSTNIWQPLSLAPPETAAKLIRDLGALVLFLVVLQWAHQRSRVWWLIKVAVLAAGAMAVLVTIQALLGISSPLMGLYHPRGALGNPIHMSPFINPNHMGAYNLFHALLCLPLLIQAEKPRERMLWAFILLLLSSYTFLSLSRSVAIIYPLGVLSFAVLFWQRQSKSIQATSEEQNNEHTEEFDSTEFRPLESEPMISHNPTSSQNSHRRKGPSRASRRQYQMLFYVTAAVVIAMGLSLLLSYTGLRQAMSETKLSIHRDKIGFILDHTKPFLQHYPWLGVGRGAMPLAWHRFAKTNDLTGEQFMITHVESNLTQPLIDWGIPVGLIFLAVIGFLLILLIIRSKGILEHSLLIAILALVVQNAVDFNLEYYGTGFPFLVFLAALLRLQMARRAPSSSSAKRTLFPAVIGISCLLVIACLAPYAHSHPFHRLPQRWKTVSSLPRDQFHTALQSLIRHHPSDYMMAIYIARHYSLQKPWEPLKALQWLERVKFLNPTAPELMFLQAYNLARLGLRQQALEAVDRALLARGMLVHSALDLLSYFNLIDFALRQSSSLGLIQLLHARQLNLWPRPPLYLQRLQNNIRRYPKDFFLRKLLISELFQLWRRTTWLATQPQDPKQEMSPEQLALAASQWLQQLRNQLQRMPPGQEEQFYTLLYRGHIAKAQQDYKTAQTCYEQVIASEKGEHWQAFVALFELYLQQKQLERAHSTLSQARQRYQEGPPHTTAHLAYLEGRLLQAQGRLRQALQRYEDASQLHHNNEYLLAQAHLCWELSLFRCTVKIYRSLLLQKPDKALQERLEYFEKEARRRSQHITPER